ncbi:MAG: ankyrin repeat domain-containing protein [Holosporales bacterium]|jgi:hypothetical protein|nr:ankyrin repeat domain-containing protein [Holosporales bacterium]
MLRKIVVGSFCVFGCASVLVTGNSSTAPASQQQELTKEELFNAVCRVDVGKVKELLEVYKSGQSKFDINTPLASPGRARVPALHWALPAGYKETPERLEILKLLLDVEGINVNVLYCGRTPLDQAIVFRLIGICKMLLERGGKIHERIRVSVGSAGEHYDQELVDLVNRAESINEASLTRKERMANDGDLSVAISSGKVERVKALINAAKSGRLNIDINACADESSPPPLFHAASLPGLFKGCWTKDVLEFLVTVEGIDLNVIYRERTPADAAALDLVVDNFEVLHKAGAKMHRRVRDEVASKGKDPCRRYGTRSNDPEYIRLMNMVNKTELID